MLVKAIVEAGTSAVLGDQVQAGAPTKNLGPLAHLVERFHGMEEATGSNPVWSKIYY